MVAHFFSRFDHNTADYSPSFPHALCIGLQSILHISGATLPQCCSLSPFSSTSACSPGRHRLAEPLDRQGARREGAGTDECRQAGSGAGREEAGRQGSRQADRVAAGREEAGSRHRAGTEQAQSRHGK